MNNPWYEVVGPDIRLTQGDIILECPLLKWQLNDSAEGESKASGERLFQAAKGIKADHPPAASWSSRASTCRWLSSTETPATDTERI